MPRYAYKLVPAPEKSGKHKGLKGAELFAATLEELLNTLGAEGWHYLRAETLPEEVRSGLTSRTTTYRNLLIFCRALPDDPSPRSPAQMADVPEADTQAPSLANLFLDRDDRPDPDLTPKP
jgi:hypothetical protein